MQDDRKKFNDDLLNSATNTLKDIIERKGISGIVWEEEQLKP
jgi:hypothetical protein